MTIIRSLLLLSIVSFEMSREETISEIYGNELLSQQVFFETGPFGSVRNGDWFTDFWQSLNGREMRPNHWPSTINVRSGERIDSIQFFYGPYQGAFHGGEGGTLNKIRLYDGDRITRVTGRSGIGPGAGVDQLTLYSKNGKTFGPYGGQGGFPFEARPPQDECYLAWISGRAFLRLDSITFHWRCPVTFHSSYNKKTTLPAEATFSGQEIKKCNNFLIFSAIVFVLVSFRSVSQS